MIISKTPLRISFAGGGTDFPSFYKKNNFGAVFSSSIDKYIYISVKKHCDLNKEKIRLNYSDTELVNSNEEINNPIIRECLKFLKIDEKIYISTVADAPGASGLGSSSAFCVGLLNALYNFKDEKINKNKLAEEAAHIEIDILKRPMGKQDHYAAALGGVNYINFNNDDTTKVIPIDDQEYIKKIIFSNLLTFWTGIERNSSHVLKEQVEKSEINLKTLIQIRNQATELYELANKKRIDTKKLGQILAKGWEMKCTLSSNITNKKITEFYNNAISSGALGGKISGAGGGGFLNLIVVDEKKNSVKLAMEKIGLKLFTVSSEKNGTTVKKID